MRLLCALTQLLTLLQQIPGLSDLAPSFSSALKCVRALNFCEFLQLACLLVAQDHVGQVVPVVAVLQGCSKVLLFLLNSAVLQAELQLKAGIGSLLNQLLASSVFRIRQHDVLVTVHDLLVQARYLVLQPVLLVSERLVDHLEALECFKFVFAIVIWHSLLEVFE